MLDGIDNICEKIREGLNHQDQAREQAFKFSRQVIRAASRAIKSVHRKEYERAHQYLEECGALVSEMLVALEKTPGLRWGGFVGDAEKEYAEAVLTIACIEEQVIVSPEQLGIDGAAWLNGLAEAGGEFRRHVLDAIREDDLEESERFLVAMEEIYYALMGFDYPGAIDRGLRGRCDALRGMLERTRGDLTNALRQARLEKQLRESDHASPPGPLS